METIQPGLHMVLDRGELLKALRAFKRGDFSVRMPLNLAGIDGDIAQAFNDLVELNESISDELATTADQVGKDGHLGRRLAVAGAAGGRQGRRRPGKLRPNGPLLPATPFT